MKEGKIIVYRVFSNLMEANIIKGVLESHNVDCFLSGDTFLNLYPVFSDYKGSIYLNIWERDVEIADEILSKDGNIEE